MKIAKVVEEMDGACKNRSNHSINIAALYFQLLSQPAQEVLMRTDKNKQKHAFIISYLYSTLMYTGSSQRCQENTVVGG